MEVLEEHVQSGNGKMGEWLKAQGGQEEGVKVQANVQKHAEGFYAKCGYSPVGEDFLEVRSSLILAQGELKGAVRRRRPMWRGES